MGRKRVWFAGEEDKDFGVLAYTGGQQPGGVILICFPGGGRSSLPSTVVNIVS